MRRREVARARMTRARSISASAPIAVRGTFSPTVGLPVAAALLILPPLAAVLFVTRRLSGALLEPLDPAVLWAAGGLLAAWAAGLRRLAPISVVAGGLLLPRRMLWLVPSLVLLLWAAALSLPGTPASGLLALWGVLALEELWCCWQTWPTAVGRQERRLAAARAGTPLVNGPIVHEAAAPLPTGEISQQLVRRREPDGRDSLSGFVRATFAPGQRTAEAHVAFCPPFSTAPECLCEQVGGPAARVHAGQLLPYGVRFDVKLDAPSAAATDVLVEFAAHEARANRAAAAGAGPQSSGESRFDQAHDG
jgi:hypothetical protein